MPVNVSLVASASNTYGSATTSAPCSSWAAEVVYYPELLQHYDMVVVVVEKILSRASPKHRPREEDKLSRGGRCQPKGIREEEA